MTSDRMATMTNLLSSLNTTFQRWGQNPYWTGAEVVAIYTYGFYEYPCQTCTGTLLGVAQAIYGMSLTILFQLTTKKGDLGSKEIPKPPPFTMLVIVLPITIEIFRFIIQKQSPGLLIRPLKTRKNKESFLIFK